MKQLENTIKHFFWVTREKFLSRIFSTCHKLYFNPYGDTVWLCSLHIFMGLSPVKVTLPQSRLSPFSPVALVQFWEGTVSIAKEVT